MLGSKPGFQVASGDSQRNTLEPTKSSAFGGSGSYSELGRKGSSGIVAPSSRNTTKLKMLKEPLPPASSSHSNFNSRLQMLQRGQIFAKAQGSGPTAVSVG